MARNREALVLLLDVSHSMHHVLPAVEKVCSRLVQKKLLFSKNDEVGVVLFGTEGTDNELEKEVGGYEHIVVLQRIRVVAGDIIETLKNIPRGTTPGDYLDAIVVGMDMLIKKFGPTNKSKQRLCLITSACYPIKEPFEGTKQDQVDTISTQMKAHGMKLEYIVIREKLSDIANQKILDENDHLLNQFSRKAITKGVHVDSATSLLGALKTRNISPVTIFRGELEVSSTMKIKVWVYKKTSEEKFPSLKKYSDLAPPSDKSATHEVKVDYEYKSVEDPTKTVPPEQRIKGYRYGPHVVPISSDIWEAVKFKTEKGVKLLGFTDASNILRHHYMKDVNIFIPEPGNRKAALAVSAMVRAMKEMNKVAILRCVWRQGQGNVVIGALTPNASLLDNKPDSFYFNVLPFAEDVREFQFPSFKKFPLAWQPSDEQQAAADDLVRMLDLAPSGCEESLKPVFTPNPVLERYYDFLELKSKQPDADVPPLDATLKKVVEPDRELLSHNKSTIDTFRNLFELKENQKRKQFRRRSMMEKLAISNQGADNASEFHNESSSTVMAETIGQLDPVKDFEAMMRCRDDPKWIFKAFRDMENYIYDLIENSYSGDDYPKAVECLKALRTGCIVEQEPMEFNRFLRNMYDRWKTTDLYTFFEFIARQNLSLISKREAVDSDVTDEEASVFPAKIEMISQ